MDTKQEWLQKLQHALALSLAQGLSQPHLNESIFHDLQSPPPSDLYPHLHQWYMNMSKKIKSSLQREQTFLAQSEQENREDDSKIHGSEFKAKRLNLKITNELTKLLQQFENQFIQKYDKISDKEFQLKSQKLINIQIYILQNFELLLYRIADIYYAKKKIYAQNLQQVYSEMQAQMLYTLNIFYKAPKQRFRALKLWIKQEFIDKVLNDNNYKDQIGKNFIIDLTPEQQQYNDYFQMPFDKVYHHRIIVVKDKQYDRTIRMVLSRYINYRSVDIIQQNQYITNKANYDNQGYSIYNSNIFFFCLQLQKVATNGKLTENQQELLKKSLEKILLLPKGGSGNLILNTDCDFYRQGVIAYINKNQPTDFTKYVSIMDNEKRWNTTSNLIKQIFLNKTPINCSRGKTISTIIGTTAEEVANIHQLSPSLTTNDFIWKYEWTHMIATSLGGAYNYDNGFVGPSFFNRVMQRYQSWLVDINKDQNFDNHQLNDILYKVSITRANYTPKKPPNKTIKSCNFGVFAETVLIEIIASYTIQNISTKTPLLIHQFNPFLKIYPMRIQKQLFQECVKQLCWVQHNRRMLIKTQSTKNLSSRKAENNQYYQYFKRRFFNKVRQYFKKNIQGQTLTISNDLSVRVKVISNSENVTETDQDEYYSIKILQLQSSLFERLCGQNILLSSLTEKLNIDEISFNINSNIIGFFVNIKSKPFNLPQVIVSIVDKIFNFKKPVLIFQGSIYFKDNFLQNPSIPTYFQIKGSLEESNESHIIEDLDYYFEDLSLTLAFRLKQKGSYEVDWSIGCLVNINHLAQNAIQLSAFFRHSQGQNKLQAKITKPVQKLMGFSWLHVEQLDLKINFTQQEINLLFACDISNVRLEMNAFYKSKIIRMKCSIEKLNINNILGIINQIVGIQLSVGLEIQFLNISLEIQVDKVNKQNKLKFELQFKIGKTTFNGSLNHEKNKLQLIASADIIQFDILGEKITLTKPKLSLTTNKQFDQLKYTGTLDYKSKFQDESESKVQIAHIETTLAVQKLKSSGQNNYWLQAKTKLNLEPTVTKLLEFLAAIDSIRLVYKSQNYLSIQKGQSDKSGKYLAIETKQFTLFKNRVKLQVIFDFIKLQLSAAVKFNWEDLNDKKSFLLLKQIGLSLKLTAVQVRLEAKFISPRLNNVLFTGALIFGPGKVGGELTMQGVVNINSYIQFGFPENSGKKTILSVAYNNEAVDFQISAAIRMHEFYGEGHIKVVADALTYLQVTVQNLDFIKIISSLINSIRSEDKDNKREMIKFSNEEANQVKLFVIDRLYFKYDIIKLNIEAQLKATIFDNQFMLKASVNPKGISFFANIQKPIGIIDLISLSSASDSSKGPLLNIQLRQKQFKIEMDCKIQFGPISSACKIKINSSLLLGFLSIGLFGITVSAGLLIDNLKSKYAFEIQFSSGQRSSTDSFVHNIINGGDDLKQQTLDIKQRRNQLVRQTRYNKRKFANNYQKTLNQSKQNYRNKKKLMKTLFRQEKKQQIKKLIANNQNKIGQIQKQIRKKQLMLIQIKNYKEYHQMNNNLFSNFDDHEKNLTNGEAQQKKLQEQIQNLKQEINKLQKVDLQTDQDFLNIDKPIQKLKGFWDSFTSWVKSAYDTIKQFILEIIDLLPHVSRFVIGASLQPSGQSYELKAYCRFTFKFLKIQHDISLQWDGHFDHQIIQQKAITQMTQLSLTYVRSVYLIPKPLFQKFKFYDIEELYIAIDNGTLQGLNITYNPSLKKNLQHIGLRIFDKNIQVPYLSIGTPQLIDIYENKTEEQKQKQRKQRQQYQKKTQQQKLHSAEPVPNSQFRYCIAKTLEFTNQFVNKTMKMTKYFCNTTFALHAQYQQSSRLVGKSKIQDLVRDEFGATSTPKLQIDNTYKRNIFGNT